MAILFSPLKCIISSYTSACRAETAFTFKVEPVSNIKYHFYCSQLGIRERRTVGYHQWLNYHSVGLRYNDRAQFCLRLVCRLLCRQFFQSSFEMVQAALSQNLKFLRNAQIPADIAGRTV